MTVFLKYVLLTLVLLFGINSLMSQTFSPKYFKEFGVKNLPVIFVMPESEEPKVDSVFRYLIKKYWELDNSYEIVSHFNDPVDDGTAIIAEFMSVQYSMTLVSGSDFKNMGPYGDVANYFRFRVKGKSILSIMIEDKIGDVDIVYALKLSQLIMKKGMDWNKGYMAKIMPEVYGNQLKEKTLLIPKQYMNKIDESDIKKNYPYKFKIVDESFIREKVLSNSDKYLAINFGNYLWSDGKTSPHKWVYSTKDGAIVALSTAKILIANINYGHSLKIKDFKKIIKSAARYKP